MTIHSSWAFSGNEAEKATENRDALAELGLVKGEDYSITIVSGYAHNRYTLTALSDKAKQLTLLEAALIADGGNLCFGGRDYSKCGDVYTGVIHTD